MQFFVKTHFFKEDEKPQVRDELLKFSIFFSAIKMSFHKKTQEKDKNFYRNCPFIQFFLLWFIGFTVLWTLHIIKNNPN